MLLSMATRAVYPHRSHPYLKPARIKKGISQDELGFMTGIAQSRLSRAERGFLWLEPNELKKVAKALGVSPDTLG